MKKIIFLFFLYFSTNLSAYTVTTYFVVGDVYAESLDSGSCQYFSNPSTVFYSKYVNSSYATTSNVPFYYVNYDLAQATLNNTNFNFLNATNLTEYTYITCATQGIESPTGDLYAWGKKTIKIILNFEFVGTCATGTIYDDSLGQCVQDPAEADEDSDGLPNKCDPDYVDYLTMDCNSDGEANGVDDDIDGDGIKNGNDPNPYVNGSASGTSETPCGASSYTFVNGVDEGSCSLSNSAFSAPDFSLNYVSNVYWDSCRQKCGVTLLTCPFGKAIKNGVCTSMEPDEGDCLGTKSCSINSASMDDPGVEPFCSKRCYCLTTQFPIRSPDNLYYEKQVSCSENAGDTTTLDNLRQNSDVNNSLPADLLRDSNATASLDVSASMKVALDSYAGAKEATQLDLLSESKIQSLQLVSANTNLKNIESSLEKFSAVSTSNDGVINSSLQGIKGGIDTSNGLLGSIDGKMTTNNSLLGDIKGLLGDLNTSGGGDSNITIGGTSFSDKHEEGEQQAIDRGNIDGSLTQIYTFLNNVSNDFTNLKNMLDGGITSPSISSGIAPTFCVTVFNRQICINLCESFGQFYSIFYYIFTSLFLLVALKIYYLAFKMRF